MDTLLCDSKKTNGLKYAKNRTNHKGVQRFQNVHCLNGALAWKCITENKLLVVDIEMPLH